MAPDVLVPDLAGWRRERTPILPDTAALDLAPDGIAKDLSPSTEAIDRTKKLPISARSGVDCVWLLDPQLQTLEAVALHSHGYRLLGAWRDEAAVRMRPFEAGGGVVCPAGAVLADDAVRVRPFEAVEGELGGL